VPQLFLPMKSDMSDHIERTESLLEVIRAWAEMHDEIRAIALVGSRARGTARPRSDIDLVLLVLDPEAFRADDSWLDAMDWKSTGVRPATRRDVQYGALWSRHVRLDDGLEVEFGFAPLSWANSDPVDAGTKLVISHGCRVLYDPDALLAGITTGLAPEIPSPISFDDPTQVRNWVSSTLQKRPWRPGFFRTFADALNAQFDYPIRIVELGSGPGHLAKVIIDACNIRSYTAIDFSVPMHDFARQYLAERSRRVHFVVKDFRRDDWAEGIASTDAVVTMQTAHEVRHRSRQPALLMRAHGIIEPGGILLFCDHYSEPGTTKDPGLFLTHDEQPAMLESVGFVQAEQLLDMGGMALYRARKR
jgi:SAM-dependent methyltransferase